MLQRGAYLFRPTSRFAGINFCSVNLVEEALALQNGSVGFLFPGERISSVLLDRSSRERIGLWHGIAGKEKYFHHD